jgi:DMSO reductase anchor subunit
VAISGLCAVGCSAMLYAVTRRELWRLSYSGPRFLGTCAVLGLSLTLVTFSAAAYFGTAVSGVVLAGLCQSLFAASACKLLMDASVFAHLKSPRVTDLKRTALLMWGELATLTQARFLVGAVGGLGIPLLLPMFFSPLAAHVQLPNAALALATLGCLLLVGGELIERSLFFMAAASPKMPGMVGQ